MEKLLHERLRDVDINTCSAMILSGLTGLEARCDAQCTSCILEQYDALADRIEREYIPRPRFEDGEPVQFGDDIEIHNLGGLLDKGIIQSFHPNNGSVWIISLVGCDHERLVRFDPKTCIIKRPTPKTLDADGVEIKVGDTVYPTYGIYQGIPSNVLDADDEAAILIDVGNSFEKYARTALTHERPVFDKDGERICKGDTVWDLDSGKRLHVEEFANRECGLVQCSNEEDGDCEDYNASMLTHREPDSLEKLRDDLYTLAARDDGDIEVEIVIFADRLTALIERGE